MSQPTRHVEFEVPGRIVEEPFQGMENTAQQHVEGQNRVYEYVLQDKRNLDEEDDGYLQEMTANGQLDAEERQRIVARKQMRLRDSSKTSGNPRVDSAAVVQAGFETSDMMLMEILQRPKDTPGLRKVKSALCCIYPIEDALRLARWKRSRPNFKHPLPCLHRAVSSSQFDAVIGVIMAMNGALVGIQASAAGQDEDSAEARRLAYAEHAFTGIFVVEILLRMLSDGWVWIFSWANFGDTLLILTTGVLPMWILKPMGVKSEAMRAFAVLRVLRLIRLVRMVRTIPMFRIFWSLVRGVIDSFRLWVYTVFLLGVTLYSLAVLCVYALAKSEALQSDALTQTLFRDVPRSMFTLFQILTLDSWSEPVRLIMKKNAVVMPVVILAIMILTLVLANLVTAVIVNNAFSRALQDQQLLVMQKREDAKRDIAELTVIFDEIDEDGSGSLSREEYFAAMESNERVQDKMMVLDLTSSAEQLELWELICHKGEEAELEDFAKVLRVMQGDARAKDSFTILTRLRRTNEEIERVTARVKEGNEFMLSLKDEASAVRQQLGELMLDLADFVQTIEPCIPKKPVERPRDQMVALHERVQSKLDEILE